MLKKHSMGLVHRLERRLMQLYAYGYLCLAAGKGKRRSIEQCSCSHLGRDRREMLHIRLAARL